jgi:hypothetical protein
VLVLSKANVCVAFVVMFPYDDLTHPVAEICRLAVVREDVAVAANSGAM